MSFILDALKKSDARRRRESAPGLHTPTPEPPRRRGGTARWIILILLLAAAAGAAYYLSGWRNASTASEQAEQNATGTSSTPFEKPDERVADNLTSPDADELEQSLTDAPLPDKQPTAAVEQAGSGETPERDRRSPRHRNVSSRDASSDDRRRPGQAQEQERESAPVPAEEAMDELRRRVEQESASDPTGRLSRQPESESEQAENGQSSDRPSDRPFNRPSDQSSEQSAAASSNEPGSRSVRRRAPQTEPASPGGVAEYVHAWELPLSVRRSIPELKLNIHVYAPEEERRFVLINGTRYGVGDSVDGAQIVAIRPEGAVMDFQSHRFLLEP